MRTLVAAAALTALAPAAAQISAPAHYDIKARFDLKASTIDGNVTRPSSLSMRTARYNER